MSRLSDVCLSVAYIGPKLTTERCRKTKSGTDAAHVTHDTDTTFKVKRSKSKSPGHFVQCCVGTSGGCSIGLEDVLVVCNCCYVAICSVVEGSSALTGEERGGGICSITDRMEEKRKLPYGVC